MQYLKNDSTISGMVTRQHGQNAGKPLIFPDELPDVLVPQMPLACLVVQDAPGAQSVHPRSYMEHSDTHIQIKHYGWTFSSARSLASVTTQKLRQLGNNHDGVIGATFIHWMNKTSGPLPLRDFPQPAHTGEPVDREHSWPYYVVTWHVYAADIPVVA